MHSSSNNKQRVTLNYTHSYSDSGVTAKATATSSCCNNNNNSSSNINSNRNNNSDNDSNSSNMSSSASGGVVGGGGSASAAVSSSLGLDADAKYLKRKVKAGSLDVHPTEKALVVNYELVRDRVWIMVMDGVSI